MCISAAPIHFSNSQLVVTRGKRRERALIYGNKATPIRPRSVQPTTSVIPASLRRDTGKTFDNMMFWPVPANYENIAPIEAKGIKDALDAIQRALEPPSFARSLDGPMMASYSLPVNIFVTEFYTFAIAQRAAHIPAALAQAKIKVATAPDGNFGDLLQKFQDGYPEDFAVAMMLFNEGAAAEAAIMLEYDPLDDYRNLIFVPTLDGHGELNFNEDVEMDHTIAIASDAGQEVYYGNLDDLGADARDCLPAKVIGVTVNETVPNGDLWFHMDDVKKGIFEGFRHLPFRTPGGQECRGVLTVDGFKVA
jgi:hypothetical protein